MTGMPRWSRSNPLALAVLVCLYEKPMHPYEVAQTLRARAKVNQKEVLELTVIGTGLGGVAKITGLLLAGDSKQPGTNYVAKISGKTLKRT